MPQSFLASGKTDETYTPEQVIIGASDVINKLETIASGAAVAALTPLGRITASGKLIKSVRTAEDGSQNPVAISIEAVAGAASADVATQVYVAGEFNVDALQWDASWTTDAQKLAAFNGTTVVVKKLGYSAI